MLVAEQHIAYVLTQCGPSGFPGELHLFPSRFEQLPDKRQVGALPGALDAFNSYEFTGQVGDGL